MYTLASTSKHGVEVRLAACLGFHFLLCSIDKIELAPEYFIVLLSSIYYPPLHGKLHKCTVVARYLVYDYVWP